MRTWLGILAFLLSQTGCNSSQSGQGCGTSAACAPGHVCVEGQCAQVCSVQSDCANNKLCLDGLCTAPTGGEKPQIGEISGNDPAKPGKIKDGIVVTGGLLADASFELAEPSSKQAFALSVRKSGDKQIELVLPTDIESGSYELVATNAAGSASATVQLTLPEVSGEQIITKINETDPPQKVELEHLANVQRRIGGSCESGQAMQSVDSDGQVQCTEFLTTNGNIISQDIEIDGSLGTDGLNVGGSIAASGDGAQLSIARPDGNYRFGVGGGYAYDLENQNVARPDPPEHCACDKNYSIRDCGDYDSQTVDHQIVEPKQHDTGQCYDHRDGGAARFVQKLQPDAAALTVTNTGEVGIGTNSPTQPLDVRGDVRLGGRKMLARGSIDIPFENTDAHVLFTDERLMEPGSSRSDPELVAKVAVYTNNRFTSYYQEFLLTGRLQGASKSDWSIQPLSARLESFGWAGKRIKFDWDVKAAGRRPDAPRRVLIELSNWFATEYNEEPAEAANNYTLYYTVDRLL
mgnify:CR=1 FL=1